MPRRRRNKKEDLIEVAVKGGMGLLILIALAGGGLSGFGERLSALIALSVLGLICIAAIAGIIFVARRTDWSRLSGLATHLGNQRHNTSGTRSNTKSKPAFVWTEDAIQEHLGKIDWYQFEKFCEAILQAEGFEVDRKGGASPDGGVDLMVRKNQTRTLIQCKHWKNWKIREPIIRQLLGSMVDFEVNHAAVFFSGDSTEPAKDFAAKHSIGLVGGEALAERALKGLQPEQLNSILKCDTHHCPKCDSEMVWRTGDFKSFWGCSQFPRCRGVLKHSGPK